tara:strand:- start:493 stop:999 length:507 start_codon:yes stop_codon:yes gene_type:complete
MKKLIILLFTLFITSCAVDMMTSSGGQMKISHNANELELKKHLENLLRKEYLVSNEEQTLKVDTKYYEAESKGLFGFGPKWQEKVIYTVKFVAEPEVDQKYIQISGSDRIVLRGEEYKAVEVAVKVYERQNVNFSWQVKEGEAINKMDIRSFLFKLQDWISNYGHSKS